MTHDDAAYHLADYVRGELAGKRHDQVARAVAAVPELQQLEAWLRQVEKMLAVAGSAIFGHPRADSLVAFALDPEQADDAVAAHAVSCPVCRDHVARTRGLRDDLAATEARRPPIAWGRHLPGAIAGIAAGLLILLAGGLWQGEGPAPAGAMRTLVVESVSRSGEAALPTVDAVGLATVTLLVEVNPFLEAGDGAAQVGVELRQGANAVWSWSGPAEAVWNPDLAMIGLAVPGDALAAGPHELIVRIDGRDALQRTVAITR